MNAALEKYLDSVDKYLKPLPISERIDIIKEMKSSILELENEGLSAEQIIERLGNPKELAKAYLGDLISKGNGFSWNRLLTICAFYSMAGFFGLLIIPSLAIIAPVLIVCAVLVPVLGMIKLIDHLLNLGIPFVQYISFQFGSAILNPYASFIISVITGIILFLIGRASWKLLLSYCKKISSTKDKLAI